MTFELKAFFNAIDQYPSSPFSPTRRYVIPIIFRMLYCCGLHSPEASIRMETAFINPYITIGSMNFGISCLNLVQLEEIQQEFMTS